MFQRILLTNDGSPLSAGAIPYVAAIAGACGAEVVVLRVSRAAGEQPGDLDAERWARAIREGGETPPEREVEAEPRLSEIVALVRAAGASSVGSLVLQGDPGPAIVEAAERLGADLVATASHGLSGMRRAILGSVATQVVHELTSAPVLVCHPLAPGTERILECIVVPHDGSALAEAALPSAQAIAHASGGAVVLVRAIDSVEALIAASIPSGVETLLPGLAMNEAEQMVAGERTAAHEQLSAVATRLSAAGVSPVTVEVAESQPAAAILEVAQRHGSRLVVMATHGRGGLGRALLGSVADEVTRDFESGAVLLVRPSE